MDLLKKGKKAIDCQNHSEIKNLYFQTQNRTRRINLYDVFLKLFFYACQKERKDSIIFLMRMYMEYFSDTTKIALRQSFFYGKYKIKSASLRKWYSEYILPIIKG